MPNDDDQQRHVETMIKNPEDDGPAPAPLSITGGERAAPVLAALSPATGSQAVKPATTPGGSPSSVSVSGGAVKDPVIGITVNGYVVRGKLGAGGMGIVYAGDHPVIGKRAAIKVLRPEIAENEEQVKRLVSEARAVNAVGHRGIIDVFGYDTLPDGRQCIVMEYLDGEPLADMLLRNRREKRVMPIPQVMVVLEEMLSALGAAHSAGVIHRDLKPSNIFLCKQRDGMSYVKLLDFGIAKLGVLGSTPQTRASMLVGTPSYMAPEQARGGNVTPAMDLYAVGIIAFEMLTGDLPFTGESVVEVLMKHAEEPPPKPSSLLMSIPDDLDDLVIKLLQKEPGDRYQSADDVRDFVTRIRKSLSESTARSIGLSIGRSIPQSGVHAAAPPSGVPVERTPQHPTPQATPAPIPLQQLGPVPVVGRRDAQPTAPAQASQTSEISRPEAKKLPAAMVAQTIEGDEEVTSTARTKKPQPASNRGLILGVLGLALGAGALAIAYFNKPAPDPVVEPPPPPDPAVKVEPPPEPVKVPVKEPVKDPVPEKIDPPPAPPPKVDPPPPPPKVEKTAPPPKVEKTEPPPKVEKTPPPKVEKTTPPAKVEKTEKIEATPKATKVDKLLNRLLAIEKEQSKLPDLEQRQLAKVLEKMKAGPLTPEQRDQVEGIAKKLEAKLRGEE